MLSETTVDVKIQPMLAIYVIIIYTIGSGHEKFDVRIKAVPKPNFPDELDGKSS